MMLEVHKLYNTIYSMVEDAWESTERLRQDAKERLGMGYGLDKTIEFKVIESGAYNLQLPRGVIELILKKLSLRDVLNSRLVSRAFNVIASGNTLWNSFNIRHLFPSAKFLLNEGDQPICSMEDYIVIKHMASKVEGKKNVTILSLSEKECLNEYATDENLSLRIDPTIKEALGNKSQRSIVAISNGVVDGTKEVCSLRREKIVANLHCIPATALALSALAIRSPAPEQIFDDRTASLCLDQNQLHSVVGGNRTNGFYVSDFNLSVDDEHPFHGIACMRELKSK